MKQNRFYNENGRWYIDLPEWTGDKSDLEMVSGADVLLEIYSADGSEVTLDYDTTYFPGSDCLVLLNEDSGGGTYEVHSILGNKIIPVNSFNVWLCYVVKFVFGEIPTHLYIKKVK